MDENSATPNGASDAGSSKKYFRTFAGDMESFKKGEAPDLSPLPEHSAGAKERLIAASPLPPPAVPPPPPPAEIPSPVPAAPPPSAEPLKTYASDFFKRVKETHASKTTMLAEEQDSRPAPAEPEPETPPSRSNVLYLVAGAILLVAGVAGAFIAYTRYQSSLEPVASAPVVSAPIFVDEREQIGQGGLAPLVAIQQSLARPLTPNNIRLLYIATTSAKSVFASLPLSAPDILLRNINPEGSMAGIINIAGTPSPFFILSVLSYGDTFSGMLSWEMLMPRTLGALFPAYSATASPQGTSASTTPAASSAAAKRPGFYDDTVANHDVRVYRDSAGRSVMLYGYWNQTTLVIARDPATFTEILGRLATARAQN